MSIDPGVISGCKARTTVSSLHVGVVMMDVYCLHALKLQTLFMFELRK